MKNVFKLLGIIALIAVIGFSMAACGGGGDDDGPGGGKTVTSIVIIGSPTKTTYVVGDRLDTSGLVVKAYYSDGTNQDVTGYTTNFDSSTAGTKTVTVSYGGKTASFTVTVNAVSGNTGSGISGDFRYYAYASTVFITGYQGDGGAVTIPAQIDGRPVTVIDQGAFNNCIDIVSITIPSSVTRIESMAFSGTGLTSVTIPDSVTSIGSMAFYKCASLTSVTIPNSVKTIGRMTFSGCTNLTGVTIPSSVTSIEMSAFSKCTNLTSITIPNSVTSIEDYAFSECTSLTGVTIPSSVTSIGASAFYGCTRLTGIIIPNLVTSIGNSAFYGCTGLASVTISNGVISIGNDAFSDCISLVNVTIPNSVTNIGFGIFSGCTSLTAITVTTANSAYSSIDGVLYNRSKTTLIQYPGGKTGAFTIPNSVTYIRQSAFSDCSNLTSVTIPSSVTRIGEYVFRGCTNLTSITFEGSISLNTDFYKSFEGDLLSRYSSGGIGTYTTTAPVGDNSRWTK